MLDIGNESFVFGSELLGRGSPTQTYRIVGFVVFTLSLFALLIGSYNLYLIKNMHIFHNAFGSFWASRTIGEVGSNFVHVVYSGPMTILQPTIISPSMGIAAFTIGYFFACHACVMHQVVSVNRMVAVCFPLKYRSIFTKRICKLLIAICWIEIVFVILSYLVIPCQMVGYSPTLYEPMERDFSYVGTTVNRFCFCVCFATVIADLVTLVKIIQIQRSGKQNSRFLRDVRFFCQTSVQNVTMMIALTMVVVVNNSKSSSGVLMQIFAFDTLILTHVNNALALIIFNPEVRARISGRILPQSAAENSKRSGRTPSVSRHPVEGTIPVLQQ